MYHAEHLTTLTHFKLTARDEVHAILIPILQMKTDSERLRRPGPQVQLLLTMLAVWKRGCGPKILGP